MTLKCPLKLVFFLAFVHVQCVERERSFGDVVRKSLFAGAVFTGFGYAAHRHGLFPQLRVGNFAFSSFSFPSYATFSFSRFLLGFSFRTFIQQGSASLIRCLPASALVKNLAKTFTAGSCLTGFYLLRSSKPVSTAASSFAFVRFFAPQYTPPENKAGAHAQAERQKIATLVPACKTLAITNSPLTAFPVYMAVQNLVTEMTKLKHANEALKRAAQSVSDDVAKITEVLTLIELSYNSFKPIFQEPHVKNKKASQAIPLKMVEIKIIEIVIGELAKLAILLREPQARDILWSSMLSYATEKATVKGKREVSSGHNLAQALHENIDFLEQVKEKVSLLEGAVTGSQSDPKGESHQSVVERARELSKLFEGEGQEILTKIKNSLSGSDD